MVNGIKARLKGEFSVLEKKMPGREWREHLRNLSEWQKTEEAANIWRNAKRGLAGIDGLNQLVSDMKIIIERQEAKQEVQTSEVQTPEVLIEQLREESIKNSLESLRRKPKRVKSTAKL